MCTKSTGITVNEATPTTTGQHPSLGTVFTRLYGRAQSCRLGGRVEVSQTKMPLLFFKTLRHMASEYVSRGINNPESYGVSSFLLDGLNSFD